MKDKKLVLKDILARLPYEVKCRYYDCCEGGYIEGTVRGFEREKYLDIDGVCISFENVKPHLRPRSSMTEEELKTYHSLCYEDEQEILECGEWVDKVYYYDTYESIDYLNSIHVDYRYLIEKNLAIAVTEENNPYKSIEK